MEMYESVNVLGEPLAVCGDDPVTGYYRDGKCNTCQEDAGSHTVCIEASKEFLELFYCATIDYYAILHNDGFFSVLRNQPEVVANK